jgi:hypothetical protein
MPWEVIWPKESVAYIRVTPKPDAELEADETCDAVTYAYGDREVTIWESNLCDLPEQDEEDNIAWNRIIWDRLKPTTD